MAGKSKPPAKSRKAPRGQAAPGKKGRKAGKGTATKLVLVTAACLLPLGLFVLPTTLLFVAGMVPTLVAVVVDRNPDKYLAVIVGSLNLCGVVPVAFKLWQSGSDLDRAVALLTDPFNLVMMFGAAAIGWAIYLIVPPLVADLMMWRNRQEIERWQARQQALVEEWGLEVSGEAAPTPAHD